MRNYLNTRHKEILFIDLGALQKKELVPLTLKTRKIMQVCRELGLCSKKDRLVLSLSFVSSVKIKKLNQAHRKKNEVTDVLSFEQLERVGPKGVRFLGDLIVCPEVARKQSKEQGLTLTQEFCVLITHGILHLLGFDHEQSVEREREMAALEQSILLRIRCGFHKKNVQKAGLIHRVSLKK